MIGQLSLALSLRDEATFTNFFAEPGSPRADIVRLCRGDVAAVDNTVYLWGSTGAGCRHLLQASCHQAVASGLTAQYLPLLDLTGFDPDLLLADLEYQSLICLEGIQAVCGIPVWERGLFNLYNALREKGNKLLISADCAPRSLPLLLPDLQSRLSAGLVFHLENYSDSEKQAIIRFRAGRLGIDLSEEVAAFILNRGERDMEGLISYLQDLDRVSLQQQRRVTIPFIKQVFGW